MGAIDDFTNQPAHAIAHLTQGLGNALQFVLAGQFDDDRQIAGRQLPSPTSQLVDGRRQTGIGEIKAGTGNQQAAENQQGHSGKMVLRLSQFIGQRGNQYLLVEPR